MASLSGKSTSGELSFEKYVVKNPRFKEIDFVMENDGPLLVKSGSSFEQKLLLKKGDQLKIIENKITQIDRLQTVLVRANNVEGLVPISKIRKPTAVNSTKYEDEVVDSFNSFFKSIGYPINIKLGPKIYKNLCYAIKVDSALKSRAGVKADPKADIIVCEKLSDPLYGTPIFISHKKAGGPEAFQQYGGLTQSSGQDIYNHKEVQQFLMEVASYIQNDKLIAPIMKPIKDSKLINLSIFGPDYGKKFSLQHTQLIGQGNPVLKMINETDASLSFSSHMSISGDLSHFTGSYLPVFGATFRAGRGFEVNYKRYNGARVGIYPKKLIETRAGLIKLK